MSVTKPDYLTAPNTSAEGFSFLVRDPATEMKYTVETLADIMSTTGDWATAESNAGAVLTSRFHDSEDSLYNGNNGTVSRWNSLRLAMESTIFPAGASDTAYNQYLAGMSAAFGNGHTSVSYFSSLGTQERRMQVYEMALKTAQGLMGLTYGAVSAMPLVVPLESQLMADACASAVETHYLAQIRAQQVRQTKAAGLILSNISPSAGTNPTPIDEVVMFGSIQAQGAAAQMI